MTDRLAKAAELRKERSEGFFPNLTDNHLEAVADSFLEIDEISKVLGNARARGLDVTFADNSLSVFNGDTKVGKFPSLNMALVAIRKFPRRDI